MSFWLVPMMLIFQPTLPHGERRFGALPARHHQAISTHAPARGATPAPARRNLLSASYFNPRSRTGSDALPLPPRPANAPFQPTLPHGERLPRCVPSPPSG